MTLERFWHKVEKTPHCWNWTGALATNGYGQFTIGRKNLIAHRFAYSLLKETLKSGLVIDHLCRNRACVNPDHLEQVSMKENLIRGIGFNGVNHRKTHCLRGHPLKGKNLASWQLKKGWRKCMACERENYHLNKTKI